MDETTTRERLLSTALELFTRRGYAAASVREIVEGSGVSKPALYYHFGSKEGIYRSIMDGAISEFHRLMDELEDLSGSPRERIETICRTALESSCERLDTVRLIYSVYYGPPQGAPPYDFEAIYSRLLSLIARAVADGCRGGEFRPTDPEEAAWGVMSIFNTVLEEQICHTPPRIGMEGMMRLLGFYLDGLSERGAVR